MIPQTIILPVNRADAARACAFLSALPKDRPWRVVVSPYRPHRSNDQNAYLWGVCYKAISDAIGYEPAEVHEFLLGTHMGWKDKRVPKKPSNPEGIESVPIRTTTHNADGNKDVLNKQDFSDYIAFVQRFAASKGVFIADPEAA